MSDSARSAIRTCDQSDFEDILSIINEAAQAYRGVIPTDCWHEPYMERTELALEIASGVQFLGYSRNRLLHGVMGMQRAGEATLIRHAYVRESAQRDGVGAALLAEIVAVASTPLLVGTWASASWAIRFYQKHGFTLVASDQTASLLRHYWEIPDRQIETSVVLRFNEAQNRQTAPIETGKS